MTPEDFARYMDRADAYAMEQEPLLACLPSDERRDRLYHALQQRLASKPDGREPRGQCPEALPNRPEIPAAFREAFG